ncbi:MAG: ABC transporter ATP-binding protein [Azospirillaceae bacterium]
MATPLLSIEGLTVSFAGPSGRNTVVEDLSLAIPPGEVYGLVGESGCGKSITALSILRLIPTPAARIDSGRIRFDGEDLATVPARRLRRIRGHAIGMIFQEPMTSLNPVFTIGDQIAESLTLHRGLRGEAARRETTRLLDMVGLPAARALLGRYPHELSGGQRQRVMIAIALACSPRLLIADEPTTALDVTIQAQILELIDGLRRELGMAVLLITHDLGVVSERCDRVGVMYAGRMIEEQPAAALFRLPRHPYTVGLMRSRPAGHPRGERLPTIEGTVPPPGRRPPGCAFEPRCGNRLERCAVKRPPLATLNGDGRLACFNPAASTEARR